MNTNDSEEELKQVSFRVHAYPHDTIIIKYQV